MKKELDHINAELERLETEIRQTSHTQQRLENRRKYVEDNDRKKRTRRLITRGAAMESIIPEIQALSEVEFYKMMEYILHRPEVYDLVMRAALRSVFLAEQANRANEDASEINNKSIGE